jgi:FtsZ-binding cell division protein ZapB
MTLDGLDALETKIRDLIQLVQDMKKKNVSLSEEIKVVRQQLATQQELNQRWENESIQIQSRIERVLGDIELVECIDEPEEISL